jgi:protein-disulfide isomerase
MSIRFAAIIIVPVLAIIAFYMGVHGLQRSSEPRGLGFAMDSRDWQRASTSGRAFGHSDADVIVVEFIDYLCPFCADIEEALVFIETENTNRVRRVLRHFPSSRHAVSASAAAAIECSAEQAVLASMHQSLLSFPIELTERSLDSLARLSIPDYAAFVTCISSERVKAAIAADVNFGYELGLRATPAFAINGRLIESVSPARLRAYILSLLQ